MGTAGNTRVKMYKSQLKILIADLTSVFGNEGVVHSLTLSTGKKVSLIIQPECSCPSRENHLLLGEGSKLVYFSVSSLSDRRKKNCIGLLSSLLSTIQRGRLTEGGSIQETRDLISQEMKCRQETGL